jgi:tetratricopeptide (TPR) repeat protein
MTESLTPPSPDDRVRPADSLSQFVDTPTVTTDTLSASGPPAAPPSLSERYALLADIAHGGMGVIWRATDTTLGREVAIKVLQDKFTPDSAAARRFAAEARITAQLQHPAIPPVHDYGKLPDDRPFLAMKLIKGRTLEELLRQRSDPAVDRGRFLAVFEQVCQAVAYAHAHQVIHRDLKPGNVMVGGFGEVQVMDWGLAKVLTGAAVPAAPEGDLGETIAGTLIRGSDADGTEVSHTQAGSILGTLANMPPEQAAGEIANVDQRSDVFGLGAMLAVILTGRPPYVGPDTEVLRVMAIRGDLAACLARLDGCGAEAELVALCKRCLAFGPADRPRDAGAVAEEIAGLRAAAEERARTAERERAAAEARAAEQRRKRRWQLAAAGTVVLALLAGLGGLGAFLRAQAQANADLRAANQREHERFELALDAIKTFHTGVSEDALLKEEQFKGLRERLLREAGRFYGKLQAMLEDQPDATSQRALAESYFLLAELTAKIGSLEESMARHQQALALRRQLVEQGEPGAELEVARSLLAVGRRRVDRSDPAKARTEVNEARGLAEAAGSSEEALAVLAESHGLLGQISWMMHEWEEYLRHAEQALELQQKLVEAKPGDSSRRQKLAEASNGLGIALRNRDRFTEALRAYQTAIEIYEKEALANSGDASLHDRLAITHNNKGILLNWMEKFELAVTEFAKAVEVEQRAIDANPAVSSYKNNQAFFSKNLGDALKKVGRSEEALQAYQRGFKTLEALAIGRPANLTYAANLARSHAAIGSVLVIQGKPQAALPEFDKATRIYRKRANPSATWWRSELAYIARQRGIALQKLGQSSEAVKAYRESLTLLEVLAKPEPVDIYHMACSYALIHEVALEKGSDPTSADAVAAGEQAMSTLRRAIAAGYRYPSYMRKDTDLDSLRKRSDFQKLLTDLEKNAKASGK